MTIPEDLRRKLKNCPSLVTLPAIALKVIEMAEDPDVGLADVEKVIRNDLALSAKLVRVANSPLFARSKKIQSILQALTLLGLDSALSLALSFSLIGALKSDNHGFDSRQLWRRSIIAAVTAQELGAKIKLLNLGALFLSGLLQDIGILALHQLERDRYQEALAKSNNHLTLMQNEKLYFDCDHAAVGSYLAETWHLPQLIIDTIKFSHQLEAVSDDNEAERFHCCIALSGLIADAWINDHQERCDTVLRAVKNLGLSEASFEELIDKILLELPELSQLFDIELVDSSEIEAIQHKSKEVLMIRDLQAQVQRTQHNQQVEFIERRSRDLEEMVRRDGLTSLYNRNHLDNVVKMEFESACKHNTSLSLAFIDVDNFKHINDHYGHQVGDTVLKTLARHLEKQRRNTDVVARYGGEEFMLVMPESDENEASTVANRILDILRASPLDLGDSLRISVSASVGIATQGTNHVFDSVEQLIKAADDALYRAKQTGRDRVCIWSS